MFQKQRERKEGGRKKSKEGHEGRGEDGKGKEEGREDKKTILLALSLNYINSVTFILQN